MMRTTWVLVGLAAAISSGCTVGDVCTTEARYSVTIEVVDDSDKAVTDAEVRYSIDGGAERDAECSTIGGQGCTSWSAGVEEVGTFHIRATSADGSLEAEGTTVVDEDECHVQPQEMRLVLE
jgi:hypothetical protein